MTILLIADYDVDRLSEQTSRALTAALRMGGEVHVLVAGTGMRRAAEDAAALHGVAKVLLAEHAGLEHGMAEPLAALVVSIAGLYDCIAAAATSSGKNVLPRVAALLDVMQISDVTEIISRDTFKRPIYAGSAVQTVRSRDTRKVLTIRASAFAPAVSGGRAPIESVATTVAGGARSRHLSDTPSGNEGPSLGSAKVVVAGGRAFGSEERFKSLLMPLASKLNAAIGASRAAVDAGYAPSEWQVGQSGKVVAPDLYLAVGISGAIQHLAGMTGARIIVAINSDADAPIFQVADYGLVANLFEAVPELERAL